LLATERRVHDLAFVPNGERVSQSQCGVIRIGRRLVVRPPWVPLAALATLLGSCTHDVNAPRPVDPPSPIIVSDVGPGIAGAATQIVPARARARSAAGASYSLGSGSVEDNVAYVSLLPNSAPGGVSAVVRDARTGAVVIAPMIDGGLDPVPVPASAGDTIHIDALTASGTPVAHFDRVTPARIAPTIVRTIPSRGKTAVPLNKSIEIIFSEPISAASLSQASIQLLRGTAPVAGTVKVLVGVTAAVVFEPAALLEPNTEYQLVVTRTVLDLDGSPFESTVTISFTTGTTVEGPVAALSIVPGNVSVHVGEQFQASVTATDAQGNVLTGKPITWFLTEPSVVTVTATGLVTARASGSGAVLAQVGDLYIAMLVQVANTLSDVGSVTLSVDTATIEVGASVELRVVARDQNDNQLRNRLVRWSSSNSGVATVTATANDAAKVTGVANGVARIIADVDGTKDTTIVSVGPIPPAAGIVFTEDTDSILVGQQEPLLGMSRNDAGGRASIPASDVQWESSNVSVLTVDATGIIAGVGAGSATVTARWNGFSSAHLFIVAEVAFRDIDVGKGHVCGLSTAGTAYCWGAGAFGQIGRPGMLDAPVSFPGLIYYPWPVTVTGEPTFASVTAGGLHTCALTSGAAAYCWGYNGDGSLGNGTTLRSWRPSPVAGGHRFLILEAGATHTCGLTVDHAAYCWGSNQGGQLGSAETASGLIPVAVQGGHAFASITVGGSHSCGLTTDGVAYCWGNNTSGQLGVGDEVPSSATPLAVQGGLTFASLSAGEAHTCGLTTTGALYCWGWNFDGQLGDANGPTPSALPSLVAGGHAFVAVSAGGSHSCAIDDALAAYCWGSNREGQLGIGVVSSAAYSSPQPVVSGLAFIDIAVGDAVSCAKTTAGIWYCWGNNGDGALGIGNNTGDSGRPLKVLGQR